ncbi:MAG: protein translocase subunit SecF [Candidatus Kerfeldbacteria bacterium]|jgi:preprotein translocase subunit SecF
MFNIIQNRKYWYIFSAIILIPSIVAILLGGLKLGIDFTGGSLIRADFVDNQPTVIEIEDSLAKIDGLGVVSAQPYGDTEMTLRLRNIDNDTYQNILIVLREDFINVEEKSFESIGPTIGQELKEKAIVAMILVLVFIVLYTSFAFRKSGSANVKPWVYGLGTLVALFHDIIIVVGIFAILGKFWNVEIDILFITALLTVLGFSVHDTIVVYDRVREKLKINYNKTFSDTVNESVNQTLVRSINTSLTTLLVLSALYLFGGDSISQFVLALIIGIIAGTYSSVFIASPFLVTWQKITNKS